MHALALELRRRGHEVTILTSHFRKGETGITEGVRRIGYTDGDEIVDRPGLTVPHPRLHERAFALEPLAELDPALRIPGHGTVTAALAGLHSEP